jgi:hypothetical protein
MKIDYNEYRKLELRFSYPKTRIKKAIYLYLMEMQSLEGFNHEKIISIDTKSNYGKVQKEKNNL